LVIKGAEHEIETAAAQGGPELASAANQAKESLQATETRGQEYVAEVTRSQVPASVKIDANGIFAVAVLEGAESKTRALTGKEAEFNQLATQVAQLVDHLHGLRTETQAIEQSWTALNGSNPPSALISRVAGYRREALATVRAFGPRDAVAALRLRIDRAVEEYSSLQSLPAEINAVAERARSIAVDPKAIAQIADREKDARFAVDGGDLRKSKQTLEQLSALAEQLNQVYTVRIVNRANEYTRIWYNNPNHTGKIYYVIVEAITAEEAVVPVAITSEQDGSTQTVRCWAERVDLRTYEQVGDDKKDDGVIENNLFAKKERGYLDPVYLIGDKAKGGEVGKGRLNQWPHRQR
jgi:hypothetical protein